MLSDFQEVHVRYHCYEAPQALKVRAMPRLSKKADCMPHLSCHKI